MGVTYHGPNIEHRVVRPLILGHALDAALFDLKLAGQSLCFGVKAFAWWELGQRPSFVSSSILRTICEALARYCAIIIHV